MYSQLLHLIDMPRTLPQQLTMLKIPGKEHKFRPSTKTMPLIGGGGGGGACQNAREFLELQGVCKRPGDIIFQFWRHRTLKQYSTYITKYITFRGSQPIDFVTPTLSQALDFLVSLKMELYGYCGINTARSFLSYTINPLAFILLLQVSSKGFS